MQLTSHSRSTFDRNSYLIAVLGFAFFSQSWCLLTLRRQKPRCLIFFFILGRCALRMEYFILLHHAWATTVHSFAMQRWTRPCYIPIGQEQRPPCWLAFSHCVTGASIPIKFRLRKFFVFRLGHAEAFFLYFQNGENTRFLWHRVWWKVSWESCNGGNMNAWIYNP